MIQTLHDINVKPQFFPKPNIPAHLINQLQKASCDYANYGSESYAIPFYKALNEIAIYYKIRRSDKNHNLLLDLLDRDYPEWNKTLIHNSTDTTSRFNTDKKWLNYIQSFFESELTVMQFCEEQNIAHVTLYKAWNTVKKRAYPQYSHLSLSATRKQHKLAQNPDTIAKQTILDRLKQSPAKINDLGLSVKNQAIINELLDAKVIEIINVRPMTYALCRQEINA